jgi:DEAD/DEAH box helicase
VDHFLQCHKVNDLLLAGKEPDARNELIKLLASLREDGLEYSPLVNHLIREVGLFPYMEPTTASWQERYIYEVFKTDVGEKEPLPLHREQSRLLNALLAGKSIAVSAPTSFGKSFVVDSFISIKNPSNVVILVPTIALADETRRRLQRKFGATYKLITTSDQHLGQKNIFVFPQERAIGYLDALSHIDILIVDEFYKASKSFDKERSPSLIRAIIRLSPIASQRYFLAPNISELRDNSFTEGMEFLRMDFNTVFLEKTELFRDIGKNDQLKSRVLLNLLETNKGKTLIYAGTYTNIEKVSNLLMTNLHDLDRTLLLKFQAWLAKNYDPNWALAKLVAKGVGVHNGRLHRSLSQIQIRLFDEEEGLDRMISTSSIIEGVNTSAENVILWSNRNGQVKIDDFTYKNIIGRGGRMFRHFIGKIFVLEEPPMEAPTQLDLKLPDELLGFTDTESFDIEYSPEQAAAIESNKRTMYDLFGADDTDGLRTGDLFQSSNANLIITIAKEIKSNLGSWNGLRNLNSDDANQWDNYLYRLINLLPGAWGIEYSKYVAFIKILSRNWNSSIPELLETLDEYEIGIDEFFELERHTTFKLASLLGDVHTIYNRLNPSNAVDLSLAISRLSHGFLPPTVYQLEEYGMPRMISRKIHSAGLLDLETEANEVHETLERFRAIGEEALIRAVGDLDEFDKYILHYFYEGIEVQRTSSTT